MFFRTGFLAKKISSAVTLAWGQITGTLSDQTDLQAALDAKSGTAHTHNVTDILKGSTTTGSIIFVGSSALAEDTTKFFWDNTNDRLGIGTNAPAQSLHVEGNIRFLDNGIIYMGTNLLFHNSGSNTNTFFGRDAGDTGASGTANAIFGAGAGLSITSGSNNVLIGSTAGLGLNGGANNTFVGSGAGAGNASGNSNTAIGNGAGSAMSSTSSGRIVIGSGAQNGTNNTAVIGDSSCANWRTVTDGGCTLGTAAVGWKGIYFDHTTTAPGTTGNRTINKPAGRVNIAAAGTTVTVTNSLVTADSLVFCEILTNDTTAQIKSVVPAAGSFVINIVACTAEVAIGFLVVNTD